MVIWEIISRWVRMKCLPENFSSLVIIFLLTLGPYSILEANAG